MLVELAEVMLLMLFLLVMDVICVLYGRWGQCFADLMEYCKLYLIVFHWGQIEDRVVDDRQIVYRCVVEEWSL